MIEQKIKHMTFTMVANQLQTNPRTLERESIRTYLQQKLLSINGEILRLAMRYGVGSVREFEKAARKGTIREDERTLEDFFSFDHLEAQRKKLKQLLVGL